MEGGDTMITVTERAVKKIEEILAAEEEAKDKALRVSLKGFG